ncbi:MAG: response regulator transcription factor [Ferruginibacter sp.]
MNASINIALVDDQQLFRQGLATIINKTEEFSLVAEAGSANELLTQLDKLAELPHVLLMDMNMPEVNGIELNEIMHQKYPSIKIMVLSAFDQSRFITKMIERGASGYLSKNCDAQELITAIRTIARTGFYFNEATIKALQDVKNKTSGPIKKINNIPVELTKREEEILILICKELSTEEIATQLFLSNRTVEGHRLNILAKTGCKNIAGLVVFAVKHGLFTLIS